jgi:hypothetical protein
LERQLKVSRGLHVFGDRLHCRDQTEMFDGYITTGSRVTDEDILAIGAAKRRLIAGRLFCWRQHLGLG